jgi:hypothetical protein
MSEQKAPRVMPKGGRVGGAVFPRVSLQDALVLAAKLVNKTHSGPVSQDIVYSAVVGAKAGSGDVKMSSLKQYGLMEGTVGSKFSATALAKQISAAPSEELPDLYQKAMLSPTIFKKLFETLHSDTYSRSKVRQRAAELKVHPSQTSNCTNIYLAGMQLAGLVTVDGEQVTHFSRDIRPVNVSQDDDAAAADEEIPSGETVVEKEAGQQTINAAQKSLGENGGSITKAVFNVNVTIDSSFDIEKLRQHLELLKQFGVI